MNDPYAGKSALAGIRVVEYAAGVSGPYCGKLFADLGADVIKIERPEGDRAREYGPFPNGEAHRERSALYLYLNTSKRGVVLDLIDSADRKTFAALLEGADIFINNHGLEDLNEAGFDWKALQQLNPGLLYTSITPYGVTGPRAGAPGDELTLVHAAGLGNLLPTRSVDISRPPVKPGGHFVGYHGGVAAATATLGALFGQRKTGRGQFIDISLQEVVLAMIAPGLASTRYHGTTWNRVPDRPPAMGRMQTEDGYVILNAMDDHHFAALRDVMGNPEWCAGEEWDRMEYRVHHLMDIAPEIDAWMAKQRKDDIHHRAAKKRIPIGPINTAKDVMDYGQYAARNYFVEVDHEEAGSFRYAGWPYKMAASPPRVSRPAPRLGEHTESVLQELETWRSGNDSASKTRSQSKGTLPLEGVRVLEFCWVWAGPYACMLLAKLGAEVIKVEGHNRTDLMRRTVVWPLPEAAPAPVPPNQGLSLNSVNMNKKSVTLDLTKPEGVALAKRLAAKSDIVVDNMRPGALSKLGLGYDGLRALREDIIVASSSGRGHEGPERQYLGYAMIHHGIGGGAYITGYPDDHPCHTLGDVDIMNATTVAFAILAALHHRGQTGEGQFVDYSQCEGVTSLLGEVLLGYEMTGEIPERMGNAHPTYAPHNVYPAWGVNRWLAIEVHSDESFATFAKILGRPELATDTRFATMKSRKKHEAELDGVVETWTRQRDRDWMAAEFCRHGIAAAPSRDARDLYADPHLKERGAFETITHPEIGDLELVGPPWKFSEGNIPATCAPLLGEHNETVLKEILGLGDSEIAKLRETGVIA